MWSTGQAIPVRRRHRRGSARGLARCCGPVARRRTAARTGRCPPGGRRRCRAGTSHRTPSGPGDSLARGCARSGQSLAARPPTGGHAVAAASILGSPPMGDSSQGGSPPRLAPGACYFPVLTCAPWSAPARRAPTLRCLAASPHPALLRDQRAQSRRDSRADRHRGKAEPRRYRHGARTATGTAFKRGSGSARRRH